jgi:cytochrome c oxidase subunit II
MTGIPLLAQSDGRFWLPDAASYQAEQVDAVFSFIFWISVFFFALIVFLMLFFILRYRFRKGQEVKAAPNSSMTIEIIWTVIPVIVVGVIFWVAFRAYMKLTVPPSNAYEIHVVGQKWKWLFEYPNGWVDDTLHVPGDQAVLLTMRSEDVIHSMYIPAFRLKMDVVPGRYSKAWFEATKTGTFDIYCAEYCGTSHSDMITKIIVHEPGGYEKWLREASSLLSPTLRVQDLNDPLGLAGRIKTGTDAVAVYIREHLSEGGTELLSAWDGVSAPADDLRLTLISDLNAILKGESIYDPERFTGIELAADTTTLLKRNPEGEDLIQLNRFLLSDALPDFFTRGPDMVEAGRYIYTRKGGCASCHTIDGNANVGPSFLGIYGQDRALEGGEKVTVDENYIRQSIFEPQAKVVLGYKDRAVMPTYKGRLSDREIDALISFLKTLRK